MRRRSTILLAASATVAALAAPMDAGAAASGPFGSTVALSGAGQDFATTEIAGMADGTTAVLTAPLARNQVSVRVRPRGSSSWGPTRTLALPAGETFVSGAPETNPLVPVRATATGFIAAWTRSSGATRQTYVATISSTGSWGTPVKVSGADEPIAPPRLEVLPDGTAAVQYLAPGAPAILVRVVSRTGTGAWSAPVTAGATAVPINATLALDASRTVTSAWLSIGGSTTDVFLRSRVGGTWGPTTVAASVPAVVPVLNGTTSNVYLAAAGSTTVAAVLDDAGPASGFAGSPSGVAVRILTRAGSSWNYGSGLLQGPGHFAMAPALSGAPDGSAVVQWIDMSDGLGAGAPPTARTLVAQRRGAGGSWSAPAVVDTIAATSVVAYTTSLRPSLAPDGAYAMPMLAPRYTAGGTIGTTVAIATRPSWAGLPTVAASFSTSYTYPVAAALVAPSGRVTVVGLDETATTVVRATPLPRPFALSGPAMSTTKPRVGVVVRCTAAWADAPLVSYRWLRAGKVISGATAVVYRPRAADRAKALACRVTASNPTGRTIKASTARLVR